MKKQEERKIIITTLYFILALAIILLVFSIPYLTQIGRGGGESYFNKKGVLSKKDGADSSVLNREALRGKSDELVQPEPLLVQAAGLLVDINDEGDELILTVDVEVSDQKLSLKLLVNKADEVKSYMNDGRFSVSDAVMLKKGDYLNFSLGSGLPISEIENGPIKITNIFVDADYDPGNTE